jgi:hypothetical protein
VKASLRWAIHVIGFEDLDALPLATSLANNPCGAYCRLALRAVVSNTDTEHPMSGRE